MDDDVRHLFESAGVPLERARSPEHRLPVETTLASQRVESGRVPGQPVEGETEIYSAPWGAWLYALHGSPTAYRLVAAVSRTTGEPVPQPDTGTEAWVYDIAGVSRADAIEIARWIANEVHLADTWYPLAAAFTPLRRRADVRRC